MERESGLDGFGGGGGGGEMKAGTEAGVCGWAVALRNTRRQSQPAASGLSFAEPLSDAGLPRSTLSSVCPPPSPPIHEGPGDRVGGGRKEAD